MDRRYGDPPVGLAVGELLGVKPRRVLEEPGQGGGLLVLLVGLHVPAQRPQVFEDPLGVAALARAVRAVAQPFLPADQPAGHRHHRDRHVRERPSRVELLARGLQAGGEPPELLARLDRADLPGGVLVAARADQVAGVTVARGGDDLALGALPDSRALAC